MRAFDVVSSLKGSTADDDDKDNGVAPRHAKAASSRRTPYYDKTTAVAVASAISDIRATRGGKKSYN
ncbi:MAG: hypothetical protein QGG42_00810 [Phycisphaerae bacterium]|jgi:hypothetical protein|nr:hypothetical protein [Phycisphaerae bacterium]